MEMHIHHHLIFLKTVFFANNHLAFGLLQRFGSGYLLLPTKETKESWLPFKTFQGAKGLDLQSFMPHI